MMSHYTKPGIGDIMEAKNEIASSWLLYPFVLFDNKENLVANLVAWVQSYVALSGLPLALWNAWCKILPP
jgi:hypothetical protein